MLFLLAGTITLLMLALASSVSNDLPTVMIICTMFFLGIVLGFIAFIEDKEQ